ADHRDRGHRQQQLARVDGEVERHPDRVGEQGENGERGEREQGDPEYEQPGGAAPGREQAAAGQQGADAAPADRPAEALTQGGGVPAASVAVADVGWGERGTELPGYGLRKRTSASRGA